MLRPFAIALQFLTRFPVVFSKQPTAQETGRSILFYPTVGLLMGLLLAALAWILTGMPSALSAALLICVWVLLTGGLHLDGLADSADAWAGGQGDPQRMLAIMKDAYLGPAGATLMVLVLLVKVTASMALLEEGAFLVFAAAPLLARTALPLLFLTTDYVRPQGLGTWLAKDLPRTRIVIVVVLGYLMTWLLLGLTGVWAIVTGLLAFALLRRFMQKQIGGTTGDTAGAVVELIEAAVLVVLAGIFHSS